MMYADTHLGGRRGVAGADRHLPPCGHPCRPRCGQVNVHHWAHHARADCDPWSESESAWHRGWKLAVPAERREVIIGRHRADLVTASGGVVELQHSAISSDVIEAREQFYGERMAWIFDVAGAFTAGRLTSTHRRTKATPRT
jgi:competence protein CoiA